MLGQEKEVEKIDFEKVKSEIISSIKSLNAHQGMHLGSSFPIVKFFSKVGHDTDHGGLRAIFEINIDIKMISQPIEKEEYDEAITQMDRKLLSSDESKYVAILCA